MSPGDILKEGIGEKFLPIIDWFEVIDCDIPWDIPKWQLMN